MSEGTREDATDLRGGSSSGAGVEAEEEVQEDAGAGPPRRVAPGAAIQTAGRTAGAARPLLNGRTAERPNAVMRRLVRLPG